MRKNILSLFAVALFVSVYVASAGVKNCNNTLVTQGVCGDTTQDVIYLRIAGTSRAEVVTALAKADGTFCTCNGTVWTATPATGSCS